MFRGKPGNKKLSLAKLSKIGSKKNKLKKSLATQNYYVTKSKIFKRFLLIIVVGYYICNLLNRGWSDEVFAIVPMLCCLIKKTAVDTLETRNLTRSIDLLVKQLNSMLKICQIEYHVKYQIDKNNRGKLANSYITLQIYESKGGDSKNNFSEKNFVSVIKSVFNYFNKSGKQSFDADQDQRHSSLLGC